MKTAVRPAPRARSRQARTSASPTPRPCAAGLTATEYGTTVPVPRLLDLAAEADWLPTVLNASGGVLDYGRTRRCAPPAMAKALRARDKGCTFPGCTRPAAWTERHHIVEHRHGGPTALDNLTLVCRYHHHAFERHGWQVTMRDGRPWWIPPATLDPEQRPRRNTHWDTPVP